MSRPAPWRSASRAWRIYLGVSLSPAASGLQLTPAGHDHLPQVRRRSSLRAIPLHQRAHSGPGAAASAPRPPSPARCWCPRCPPSRPAHPGVELELTLSVPLLAEGDAAADVEIRHGPVPESISVGASAAGDRLTPLAAPAMLEGRALSAPADLLGLPLLRTRCNPGRPGWQAAGISAPEPTTSPRFVDPASCSPLHWPARGVALMRLSLAQQELRGAATVQPFALTVEAERHSASSATGTAPQRTRSRPGCKAIAGALEAATQPQQPASYGPAPGSPSRPTRPPVGATVRVVLVGNHVALDAERGVAPAAQRAFQSGACRPQVALAV